MSKKKTFISTIIVSFIYILPMFILIFCFGGVASDLWKIIVVSILCLFSFISIISGMVIYTKLTNKKKIAAMVLCCMCLNFYGFFSLKKFSNEELHLNIYSKIKRIISYYSLGIILIIAFVTFFLKGMINSEDGYVTFFEIILHGIPGSLAMFIIYLLVIISSFILTSLYEFGDEEKSLTLIKISCPIYFVLLLISGILSFSTISLVWQINPGNVRLGEGPIIFGVVCLMCSLGYLITLFNLDKRLLMRMQKRAIGIKQSADGLNEGSVSIDNEKINLLKEYKQLFDEGIITEEQFNKKRDELLGN